VIRSDRGKSWLLILVALLGATCGGDDGDGSPQPPHDAGGGTTGGGGRAGAGGTGGAGGSDGHCPQGWCDCDRQSDNGFEISINDDPRHCGECGKDCSRAPNSAPSCNGGVCGMACDVGFADCNGVNGCETELATAITDCGACGRACNSSPPHGRSECVDGTCRVECAPDFADCDLDGANGCEVDLNGDPENCGRCSHGCPLVPGGGTCRSGLCELSCPTGRADCNVDFRDGCEIDTTTDRLHCGACAVVCDGGACVGGHCGPG